VAPEPPRAVRGKDPGGLGTGSRPASTIGPASRRPVPLPDRADRHRGVSADYVSLGRPEDEAGLLSGTANYELKGHVRDSRRLGRSAPRVSITSPTKRPLRPRPLEEADLLGHGPDQFFPVHAVRPTGRFCLLPLLGPIRSWSWTEVPQLRHVDVLDAQGGFLKENSRTSPSFCMTATLPANEEGGPRRGVAGLQPVSGKHRPADLVEDSNYPRYQRRMGIDQEGARSLGTRRV